MPDSRILYSLEVSAGDAALGNFSEMVEVGQEKCMGPGENGGAVGVLSLGSGAKMNINL